MENLENNVVTEEVQAQETKTEEEVKTFTQEEVNEMIAKRIAREAKKIEAEKQKAYQAQLEAELKESERLMQMNEADRLKAKAEKYLAENCMPKASYKLQLSELGKEVGLGDTIQLVDKLKRIKQKQRVVKIVRYPQEPERDNIEISNLQADFARDFVKQQKEMRKELDAIKKQLADVTRG